jgi:hypothetical protein
LLYALQDESHAPPVSEALAFEPRHPVAAGRVHVGGKVLAASIEHLEIEWEGADLAARGLEWVNARDAKPAAEKSEPVFMWMHFYDPHRWGQLVSSNNSKARQSYDKLLGYLAKRKDTVVIITSDHAESLGDHGFIAHSTSLYNAEIQVPFLVRGPDVQNRRIPMPVGLVDLLTTLLDLAGFDPPGMPAPRAHFRAQQA